MSFRINSNVNSLNAYKNLAEAHLSISKVMEKITSGLRINRAADDSAGLAVSNKLNTQVLGLQAAIDNTLHTISMTQVFDGAFNEVQGILQRIRELAVQAASDTLTDTDRKNLQTEYTQLKAQIIQIGNTTQFNKKKYLQSWLGEFVKALFESSLPSTTTVTYTAQVGANGGESVSFTFYDSSDTSTFISNSGTVNLTTRSAAETSIRQVDRAISVLTDKRSQLGAFTNRLEAILKQNQVAMENQMASKSRIMDVDMANATVDMIRWRLQSQVGVTALQQANISWQTVLLLYRR